jgi:hypothetical protein
MAQALLPFQNGERLQLPGALESGSDWGKIAWLKKHKRLYFLAKIISGPSPAPLQKLPFALLLAAFFAIGLAASFLAFYIFLGLVAGQ